MAYWHIGMLTCMPQLALYDPTMKSQSPITRWDNTSPPDSGQSPSDEEKSMNQNKITSFAATCHDILKMVKLDLISTQFRFQLCSLE